MTDDSESAVMREVRLALSAAGCVVWRNNVGTDTARGVRYGLQVGSGDLIGIAPGGRFLSVEVKRRRGGRVSAEQTRWLELVRARGGVAIVARSGAEAVAAVEALLAPRWAVHAYHHRGFVDGQAREGWCASARSLSTDEVVGLYCYAASEGEAVSAMWGALKKEAENG